MWMPQVSQDYSLRTEEMIKEWDSEIRLSGVDNQRGTCQMMTSGWVSIMVVVMRPTASVPCPT